MGTAVAAQPSPRSAPRELGHQRRREHGPLSDIDLQVINASAELDRLEDLGDQDTLAQLAGLYRERGELARRYSELLTLARRLSESSREYDRVLGSSNADDVAAELQAVGVVVLDADAGTSPEGHLEMSKLYARLSRIAGEAAAGLKNHHQIGELLGVAT